MKQLFVRMIGRLLISIVVLLGVLSGGLFWLLATSSGLVTSMYIAQRILPGQFSYEQLEGSWLGPLTITQLHYQADDLDIKIAQLESRWQPMQLLTGHLQMDFVKIKGIELRLPTTNETIPADQPPTLPEITLPIAITVTELVVSDVRVWIAGQDQPIKVDSVLLSVQADHQRFTVQPLQIRAPLGEMTVTGQWTAHGQQPIDVALLGQVTWPHQPMVAIDAHVTGELLGKLKINMTTHGALESRFTGDLRDLLTQPRWAMQIESSTIIQKQWVAELAGRKAQLNVKSEGSLNAFQLTGNAQLDVPELGLTKAQIALQGNLQAQLIELIDLNLRMADQPAHLHGKGSVHLATQEVSFEGQWQTFSWPFVNPQLTSQQGTVHLKGSLNNYQVALQTTVSTPPIPEAGSWRVIVQAIGNERQIKVSEMLLKNTNKSVSDEQYIVVTADVHLPDLKTQAAVEWQQLIWPVVASNTTHATTREPTPSVIRSPQGQLTFNGTPQSYRLTLQTAVVGDEFGTLHVKAQMKGTERQVTLTEAVITAVQRDLKLLTKATLNLKNLAFEADGRWQAVSFPLVGTPQATSPRGQFKIEGTLQDTSPDRAPQFTAQIQADIQQLDMGLFNAQVQVKGTSQLIRIEKLTIQDPQSDLRLTLDGQVRLADLNFMAQGHWQKVQWPLKSTPQLMSPQGQFLFEGTPQNYRFTLNTPLRGPDVPNTDLSLRGQGTLQGIQPLHITAKTLGGEVTVQGQVAWQPRLQWQAIVDAKKLDPSKQWPDLSGDLAIRLQTRGHLSEQIGNLLQADLQLDSLSGTFNGQPVQGRGHITIHDQIVTIHSLNVQAGKAQLTASGRLTESWNVRWQLALPELHRLMPTARGAIQAAGTVTGSRMTPKVDASLKINGLSQGDIAIQQLQGKALIDLAGRSQMDLTGSGIQVGGQNWTSLRLEANGTPQQHTVQLQTYGDLGRLDMALTGRLETGQGRGMSSRESSREPSSNQPRWQGQWTRAVLTKTPLGDWRLEKPIEISASYHQVGIELGCLVSVPTRLCLQGRWDKQRGSTVQVDLDQFTLQRLGPWLPDELQWNDGAVSGQARATLLPNGRIQGAASIRLPASQLRFKANGTPLSVPVSIQMNAQWQDAATATAVVDLGTFGRLNADVTVQDPLGRQTLTGAIRAQVNDLKVATLFIHQLHEVEGKIDTDVSLSGTIAAPHVGGVMRLLDGAVAAPEWGVRIRDIQFTAQSNGAGILELAGQAHSGEGQIRLTGQLHPAEARLNLAVTGSDFQIADAPDKRATIAPDITLVLDQNLLTVEGQVTVPKAYFSHGGEAGLVRVNPSADVVLVRPGHGDKSSPARPSALAIVLKIRVILPEVRVEAYDFAGNLKGDVLVEQSPQLSPRGTGHIEVETGEYTLYGQPLQVERGRILFSGSPLDNPGLDLRVSRSIDTIATTRTDDQVVVGAQIVGALKTPKIQLFSIPPMPDSSILSYLVIGQAPDAANQASLMLGRYLSPKLYVGYGIGIFEPISTFILRYRFTRKLRFEATSTGTHTGADLFYVFEVR